MTEIKKGFFAVSVIILIMAALFGIGSRSFADPDLWGHLRFGLDMIESGHVIQMDPYSYLTADQRWINHELLAEISFALAWLAGNVTGLILLKTAIVVLTLGTIFFFFLHRQVPPIMAGILVFIAWFGLQPALGTIRPHMFTILFTAIVFRVISLAENGRYRWLWVLPPVFALWVNFHGGFLAGLAFLGLWSVVHTILNRDKWLSIIPPVLLSFIAVLFNPYGLDLITFLLRTATVSRPEILEWQPIQLPTDLGIIYLVLLVIGALGLGFSRRYKPKPIIILFVVAAILPLASVRHLPLFALAMLIFAGEHIADAKTRIRLGKSNPQRIQSLLAYISIFLAIIILFWGYLNSRQIWITNKSITLFPTEIVSLIKESGIKGNLAVEFNWGEYVIWHLGPEIKVSVDGRRETVYSEEIYEANLSYLTGGEGWATLIDEYDTNIALITRNGPAYNLMKTKRGWDLIYENSTSALFASQEWTQIGDLRRHASEFVAPPPKDVFP
jgi:hypothetical protein